MMHFYSETKKIKFFMPPPPEQKGTEIRRVAKWLHAYACVFVYTSSLCPEFLSGEH